MGPRLQAHVHKAQQNCKKQTRGSSHVACRPQRAGGSGLTPIHHLHSAYRLCGGRHPSPLQTTTSKEQDVCLTPSSGSTLLIADNYVVMGSSELRVCTLWGG